MSKLDLNLRPEVGEVCSLVNAHVISYPAPVNKLQWTYLRISDLIKDEGITSYPRSFTFGKPVCVQLIF